MLKILCIFSLFFFSGNADVFHNLFPDTFATPDNNELKPKEHSKLGSQRKAAAVSVDKTDFNGKWEVVSNNSGVSAMHAILMPKINKVLMYDATIWRISKIPLPPEKMPCHLVNPQTNERDCWAHAVLFDVETSQLTALKLETDTWCSSGGLTVDGNLVSTGGFQGGANTVRYLDSCDTCDWKEFPTALADPRWYSTQVTLPDGRFIVVGGRGAFTYEYIPPEGQSNKNAIYLPLLRETDDNKDLGHKMEFKIENNLYPFVHLSPDGNLFIFANNRSILLNPTTNEVVHEFPILGGGARNYPASAMSVILPIKLHVGTKLVNADVLICGGAKHDAFYYAEAKKRCLRALQDCGKIKITKKDAIWKTERMPSPRVMGDMAILPNGHVLMVNGAKRGTSAWHDAEDPNMVPVLYKPKGPKNQRFKELTASKIPRMYHSSFAVLPDGKVLIAGSNTNDGYVYNVKYPTELRVEKFSPPYLDPALESLKLDIVVQYSDKVISYGKSFSIQVKPRDLSTTIYMNDIRMSMYAPPFTTHGISMNQRLLILGLVNVVNYANGIYNIVAEAPPSGAVAPPGYYMLSVVYKGVPSVAMWIQIK